MNDLAFAHAVICGVSTVIPDQQKQLGIQFLVPSRQGFEQLRIQNGKKLHETTSLIAFLLSYHKNGPIKSTYDACC
jgi:hypothetical protein